MPSRRDFRTPTRKGKPRRSAFRRWFRLFFILLVLATVGVSAAVSGLIVYIGTLPPIEKLETYSPPIVSYVFDRHTTPGLTAFDVMNLDRISSPTAETTMTVRGIRPVARFKREYRELVQAKDIPQELISAFLAAEDEHFYSHFGIDFGAVIRAVIANLRAGSFAQGFSTITLQLPRNIDITSREKTLKRKLRDMVLALQIEQRYSKNQILEFYLNQVYLGSGAYGVKAAAKTYFNKDDLDDLTVEECALLAAMPQAPSLYSPTRNPDGARKRRDWVLRRMLECGFIDRATLGKKIGQPIQLTPPGPEPNRAPYFVEYMRTRLVDDRRLDLTDEQQATDKDFNNDDLYNNGYRIYTTIDMAMQRICDEEMRVGLREAEIKWQNRKRQWYDEHDGMPPRAGDHRIARVVSITSDTLMVDLEGRRGIVNLPATLPYWQPGEILKPDNLIDITVTEVESSRARFEAELFDKNPIQGAAVVLNARTGEILAMSGGYNFYDEAHEGQWNRAVQAARQVGSCFKPFVYALAFDEAGLTPATVFYDRQVVFGNGYSPRNYEKIFFGPTTLQVALEHSRNVVTILLYKHLLDTHGARNIHNRLLDFDLVDGNSWDFAPSDITIALGSLSITPLELAAAYIPFVNRGVGVEPTCLRELRDKEGRVVRRFKANERVVISPVSAYQMVHLMRQVVLNGTGKPVHNYFEELRAEEPDLPIPKMCGKTGTTNDCTDAWYAGYTPDLVVVVYMGFDAPRSLGERMSGSYVASPTWCRIVERILRLPGHEWKMDFDRPAGIEFADVDAESGRALADGTRAPSGQALYNVPFKVKTVPPKVSD